MKLFVKKPRLHCESSISETHSALSIYDAERGFPIKLGHVQVRRNFKHHLTVFSPRPGQLIASVLETFFFCSFIQPIDAMRAVSGSLLICGFQRVGLSGL